MKRFSLVLMVSALLTLAGCANNPHARAEIGAGVGALAGAVIGHQLGDQSDTNTAIGAVVGALAGGAVGNYMDNEHAELQRKLAAEQARKELFITRMGGNTLRIGVASDASFAVDSAKLSFKAKTTFNKIANVLKDYNKTAILVVGFTDSTGSSAYNMNLSRQRASSVASFLASHGVSYSRIKTYARGETQPIASNATEQGRARNRRVAIILRPIIKGQEQAAFAPPPYLGS